MALSQSIVIISVPLDQTKPQCLLEKTEKSSNNFSIAYWLVLLLLTSFSALA